jgi:acyl carrier protein
MEKPSSDEILGILKAVRPEADFTDVEDFFDKGLLDSFDLTTLVVMLEERFDVSIDGRDIVPENFNNVVAIVSLVTGYRTRG